jgi:hypothetical protein
VIFQLALTFGLKDDPVIALETAVGRIEHATDGNARSLFASAEVETVRQLHPGNPRFQRLTAGDRPIVSEPVSDLPDVWRGTPQATAVTIQSDGALEERPFRPGS